MTLKQFVYLAAGAGTAYLFFVFLAAPAPLLAWPVIVISSFLGVAFAFIPIAGRPLDHWTKAFLKAIYSPTKRIWEKQGKLFNIEPLFNQRLNIFLSSQAVAIVDLGQLSAARAPIPYSPQPQARPAVQPFTPPPSQNLPTTQELQETVELAKEAQTLQVKILESQRELDRVKAKSKSPDMDIKTQTEEFNTVFTNLQKLLNEAQKTKQELAAVTREPIPLASDNCHLLLIGKKPEINSRNF